MLAPDRQGREWDVLVLRTAGVSQKVTVEILGMSLSKMLELEGWFGSLPDDTAQRYCSEEVISRTVRRLLEESYQVLNNRQRQRLEGLAAENVLRNYAKVRLRAIPDIAELASRYTSQLKYVPPLDLILPPLEPGMHQFPHENQMSWYVGRNEYQVVRTVSIAGAGREEDDATFYVHVSLDGTLLLACPAEEDPAFDQLLHQLGEGAQERVSERRHVGTQFLKDGKDALRALEVDSLRRTGAEFRDLLLQAVRGGPVLPFLPKPNLPDRVLEDAFWRSAYQLALSAQIPDEATYGVRQPQGAPLFAELLLGDMPVASGFHVDVASWAESHRQLIAVWRVSPMMINLRHTHNELVEVYQWLSVASEQVNT